MDLKRTNYLPTLEPLDQSNPAAGHMQRPMAYQDNTDGGIIQRIMTAAQQGLIHPQVANYLMENLLDDDRSTNQVIGKMPQAPMQPNPMDVVKKGLLSR
jgi:hypothetical protein